MTYAEFRLVISPDLATQGNWQVTLQDCPVPGLAGPKGSVAPRLTRAHLDKLRSRGGWPNPAQLQQIGTAVRQSVLTADAAAAFIVCRQTPAGQQGLRFVLVLQGEAGAEGAPGSVQLSELPVEALYTDLDAFLATDVTTPISRSFQWKPDRPPHRVVLPLRVLVAMASPTGKPPANIAQEADAIRAAVRELTDAGTLEIDFLEQATRDGLAEQLAAAPYHILHFIGHGGFDVVGDVESPRAHLCFVRADNGQSEPTDAETLSVMLRNSGVRLLVLTACSTAAPTPPVAGDLFDAGPLGTRAFDGVAQRTVAGTSGVTAAVAMQFDLEDVGAVQFSKVFYENLLRPGVALDEVVTKARQALVLRFEVGHRAWVTPTVYWRCQGGNVFDIEPTVRPLDAATLQELQRIDAQLTVYREHVERISAQPPEVRVAVDGLRLDWIARVEELLGRRAELLGESLRVGGARVAAGQEVRCRLSMRARQNGVIGLIQLRLEYPADKVNFSGSEAGADATSPPAIADLGGGVLKVVLVSPSAGQPWTRKEYELGYLRFVVRPQIPASIIDIRLTAAEVTRDGHPATFAFADGVLFVE